MMAYSQDDDRMSYTDCHTIFMTELGLTTTIQLDQAITLFFVECGKYFKKPTDFWGKWKINVVTKQDGNFVGVAYVFFSKSEAYYVISGKNMNGTLRYKEIPNPNYKEENSDNVLDTDLKSSWGDVDMLNDKTIKILDEDLVISFPVINLTVEQTKICGQTEIYPHIKPCVCFDPKIGLNKYILFANNIPSWVTEADLRTVFDFFTNSKDKRFPKITLAKMPTRQRNGFHQQDNWRSSGDKKEENLMMAFIKFNSNGSESLFALVMTKRIVIKGTGSNSTKKAELFFSHAKDRGFINYTS